MLESKFTVSNSGWSPQYHGHVTIKFTSLLFVILYWSYHELGLLVTQLYCSLVNIIVIYVHLINLLMCYDEIFKVTFLASGSGKSAIL